MDKLYEEIVFVNDTYPALNEANLNAMSEAIDKIDDRVIEGYAAAVAAATYAATCETKAAEASASATAAATSETNAATSETNAAKSATYAKDSEDVVASYGEGAYNSSLAAAQSASAAATSESNASGYASQVETRAQEILSWESKAEEYATAASGSASAAATSETNAAGSATAAEASAVKAENYAKQAGLIGAHLTVNTTTASFDGLTVTAAGSLETQTATFSDGAAAITLHYLDTYTVSVTAEGRTYSETVTPTSMGQILEITLNEHYSTVSITTTSEELASADIKVYKDSTLIDTIAFVDSAATYKAYETGTYTFTCTYDGSDYSSDVSVTALDTAYSTSIDTLKIVSFAEGTWDEIGKMLDAHYAGKIDIADYWSVGDTKTDISLSAMAASGTAETHAAQTVGFTIVGIKHDDLATTINGNTKAAITLSQTDSLIETGYMNNSQSGYENARWSTSKRKTWMATYENALPSALENLIKTVKKLSVYPSDSSNTQTIETTSEKCFLFSNWEIFGESYSTYVTSQDGNQYDYFKTASNRIKKVNGEAANWFSRTGYVRSATTAMYVRSSIYGEAGAYASNGNAGIAPGFCI